MLLEDAGLLAERRRLVLPVVRRPDRELELILRPCALGTLNVTAAAISSPR